MKKLVVLTLALLMMGGMLPSVAFADELDKSEEAQIETYASIVEQESVVEREPEEAVFEGIEPAMILPPPSLCFFSFSFIATGSFATSHTDFYPVTALDGDYSIKGKITPTFTPQNGWEAWRLKAINGSVGYHHITDGFTGDIALEATPEKPYDSNGYESLSLFSTYEDHIDGYFDLEFILRYRMGYPDGYAWLPMPNFHLIFEPISPIISGTVRCEVTKRLIPGVTINLYDDESNVLGHAITDETGYYIFNEDMGNAPPLGDITVGINPNTIPYGYVISSLEEISISTSPGSEHYEIDFFISPPTPTIVKTVTPEIAAAGNTVTYTITINTGGMMGTSDSRGSVYFSLLEIIDPLNPWLSFDPGSFSIVSGASDANHVLSGGTYNDALDRTFGETITISDIMLNGNATDGYDSTVVFRFTALISPDAPVGNIANVVRLENPTLPPEFKVIGSDDATIIVKKKPPTGGGNGDSGGGEEIHLPPPSPPTERNISVDGVEVDEPTVHPIEPFEYESYSDELRSDTEGRQPQGEIPQTGALGNGVGLMLISFMALVVLGTRRKNIDIIESAY